MLPPIGRPSRRNSKISNSLSDYFEDGFESNLETVEEENVRSSKVYATNEIFKEPEPVKRFGRDNAHDNQHKVNKEKFDSMKALTSDLETTSRTSSAGYCSQGSSPHMGIMGQGKDENSVVYTNEPRENRIKPVCTKQASFIKGESEPKNSVSSFTSNEYVPEVKYHIDDTVSSNFVENSKSLEELDERKVKDDSWGDLTDVFNMLSDGLNIHQRSESVVCMENSAPLSLQKGEDKIENLTFGEYQPSCLSSGKRVAHGRRRTTIVNSVPKRDTKGKCHENLVDDITLSNEQFSRFQHGGEVTSNKEVSLSIDNPIIQPQIKSNQLQSNSCIPIRCTTLANDDIEHKLEQNFSGDPSMPFQKHQAATRIYEKGMLDIPERIEVSGVSESLDQTQVPLETGMGSSEVGFQEETLMQGSDMPFEEKIMERSIVDKNFLQILERKEHVQNDSENRFPKVAHLKEQKVEGNNLAIGNFSALEFSNESLLLKRVEQEKMESQCLAAELSSEVRLLQSSSVLAHEKLHSLQTVHQEEVNTLKHIHAWELEGKEKQIEQSAIQETLTQLMEKANDWSFKLEALQGALAVERELINNDRVKWLDALRSSVYEQQVCLQEWGKNSGEILSQGFLWQGGSWML